MMPLLDTLTHRLTAFGAMLCMVAVVMSGLGSVQIRLQALEHQAAGDQLLADGGWAAPCHDDDASCRGHMQGDEPASGDLLAVHHHHHNSAEVSQGLAAGGPELNIDLNPARLDLRPSRPLPLAAHNPALPYQPPRA